VDRRRDRDQGPDIGDADRTDREDDGEQAVIVRAEFAHQQDVQEEVEQALDQFA
jgi:hypothetical protein